MSEEGIYMFVENTLANAIGPINPNTDTVAGLAKRSGKTEKRIREILDYLGYKVVKGGKILNPEQPR